MAVSEPRRQYCPWSVILVDKGSGLKIEGEAVAFIRLAEGFGTVGEGGEVVVARITKPILPTEVLRREAKVS